ncbi:MAG: mercuric reductase [Candidatus Poribacteria bacterium]|nr:MAG: mercuric reductase [Candidatus Poribacteria bacterium]
MSRTVRILPEDRWNQELVANVHPPGWENPTPSGRYNLVVIGAGSGGLVAAMGAAGLGAKVALIERHLLGGDCLNYGCVPSKSLIRSARAIGELRRAKQLGVVVAEGSVRGDFAAVMERVRRVRAAISHHDSAERFQRAGVDVYLGTGRFVAPDMVEVDGQRLRFSRAVIATGTRPRRPEVPGLEEAGYLTNETVFSLTGLPSRLAVFGGGPIGCELAQAFQRLGAQVVLFHRHGRLLNREDSEAAELVQRALEREGVRLLLTAQPVRVEKTAEGKRIDYTLGARVGRIVVDEILVAVGRRPNVEELNLEAARVCYDLERGVHVNDFLQTTNRRVYAVGDVCMRERFTHAADVAARIVLQNALFPGPKRRLSRVLIPHAIYTDPELAQVGLTEDRAQEEGIPVDVYRVPLEDLDRAQTDGESEGVLKVVLKRGHRSNPRGDAGGPSRWGPDCRGHRSHLSRDRPGEAFAGRSSLSNAERDLSKGGGRLQPSASDAAAPAMARSLVPMDPLISS